MHRAVEFFFYVGSPASYLALTQPPALCEQAAVELVYRPMLLGGVYVATGNASPATFPAKSRHMLVDLERFARRYRVPLTMNPHFPANTLYLMRAVTGIQMHEPAPQRVSCGHLQGAVGRRAQPEPSATYCGDARRGAH